MDYEPVIGLEVHIQTKTKSKMFCYCRADYFEQKPNTFICPVCIGLPGALPVPNFQAIENCLKLGLALNCHINKESKFDRKNYFYPDLPKGYQISQYDVPFCKDGYIEIELANDSRRIRINRIHMEEDTSKSIHDSDKTLLDFNKSGIPLIELVTEPEFNEVEEVLVFAKSLRHLVRYLKISDADMEKGQMRFELNMSLRPSGTKALPDFKVEVKNIGSISVLEKVIQFEFARQQAILDSGKKPAQETRGIRDLSGETISQRSKEDAKDYRYFPEPDIPPIILTDVQIQELKEALPELPAAKKARYVSQWGLESNLAENIISTVKKAQWFEAAVEGITDNAIIKEIAKWFVGDVMALLKANKIKLAETKLLPLTLAKLVGLLKNQKISGTIAKQVLVKMVLEGIDPEKYIQEQGLAVVDNTGDLEIIAQKVIAANPRGVADYHKKPTALQFLVGQMMRETKGKANPKMSEEILKKLLA